MGLSGSFDTMSVREILGWIDSGNKTGTLEVERHKILKRIHVRNGRVVGCSSNAPVTLMGQFLLSRGVITGETLREALGRQSNSDARLGQILLEMGAITQVERDRFVAAKVEETIYGLFDWTDAVFRFQPRLLADPNAMEVDLEIPEILRRGARRRDEGEHSRQVIHDRGIVLAPIGDAVPDEIAGSPTARRIFDLIDGKKTVAEILLHSHTPEFPVLRLLTTLVESSVVEIAEIREDRPDPLPTASEFEAMQAIDAMFAELPAEEEPAPSSPSPEPAIDRPAAVAPGAPAEPPSQKTRELQTEINVALQLMASGKPGAALDLLSAIAVAHPEDGTLRQLVVDAEQDFCQRLLSGEVSPSSVPFRTGRLESGTQMSPEESFLYNQISGRKDVQALLWIAPMRDVQALKVLHNMVQKRWIGISKGDGAGPESTEVALSQPNPSSNGRYSA